MAAYEVGTGTSLTEEQQLKQQARALISDLQAVAPDIIAAYEALSPAQRSAIAGALTTWNTGPSTIAEVNTNLNALYALSGPVLAMLRLLVKREIEG